MIGFLTAHAALWPLIVPVVGVAITTCLWNHPRAQRAAARATIALLLGAALLLLATVIRDGVQVIRFGGWAAPFGIVFAVDALGAAMVAITGVLAAATMLFGVADIRRREEQAGFYPLFLGMLAGVDGAFLTGDVFNLYVWFEVMLITSVGLLVIGRSKAQIDGALRYAVLNLFSTLFFLTGVALLYGATGTLNMADLARVVPQMEPSIQLTIAALLLFCGFGIKAGYFPLFFWLPASYHTASITVAAIFAGLLTKVGVYACFRIFTLVFPVDGAGMREILAVIAACTMLFGVFGAAVQWDVRRILSFHIVSQIGYMLLGLAISTEAALAGAIFYVIHHIVVQANLFLVAGAIHRASGTWDLRKSGGLLRTNPLLAALFLVPALSLGGIPPLSGFWAKLLVIDATFRAGEGILAAVALFVGLLTLYSMTKIWIEAFWKPAAVERKHAGTVPLAMVLAIGFLAAITLTIGFQPEAFIDYARSAAAGLLDPASYVAASLAAPTGGQ